MKLLIIAYYYPPISTGGTMRPVKMGKYLPRLGHDVAILTHTYGQNRNEQGNPEIIRIRDISYNKDRTGIRQKLQWLGLRLFTELLNKLGIYHSIYTWWKRAVIKNSQRIIEQFKPDVIIATYPPVETLEIGVYLSKTHGIPLITDFRDGLIFEPIETKRMEQHPCIRKNYQRIEAEAVASSTAVTAIAGPIIEYYRETYQPPHVEVISNAFDPEDLDDLPDDIRFDPYAFNIVFTGRFALSDKCNRVDFFFEAVRLLIKQDKEIAKKLRIHLVGEYRKEEINGLKDLIDQGIVINHGFVERKRALAYQEAADLLLIITLPDRRSSTSAKIFEYLYSGNPILALTYQTVLADIITETRTGWNVHPQQVNAIADILRKIVMDQKFYEIITPDWDKIERYSIETQMKKLNRLLIQLKGSNSP
jgi:glycosyltransferase involved in cell wall biosynthesis